MHCFPDLKRISGQCDDFKNFDALNCAPFFCFQEKRMTWKAHCFLALKRIWGQFHDFENFDAEKCDLAKTCCASPEKSVLYNFHGKRTVFQFWREIQASVTILKISRSKRRFGQNVLRMTWKERFVQFSWKVHCVPVLTRISCQGADFENFDAQKCDFHKEFHEKTHCFPDLKRISGQCDDFKNFNALNCAPFFCFQEKRMTWKAHSFSPLKRIWGQFHEF